MTLRASLASTFEDPFSMQRMKDPLINTTCGHSYEAEQINGWVASRSSNA
jgi:SUMO ligase MMS21 Smc5/6 complex component